MKIHTLNHLQDSLDRNFSWRLQEIANLKLAIRSSKSLYQATLIRAGVPLIYAHWEGFVKTSIESYLVFVANKHHKYEELASSFIAIGIKNHLQNLLESSKANKNIAAVDFFMNELSKRAYFPTRKVIDTRSNLSSTVFENIILSVGINPKPYESKYHLIDTSLLKRRNHIAHGEHLELDANSYKQLADEIINLMRKLKNDIENSAQANKYLR